MAKGKDKAAGKGKGKEKQQKGEKGDSKDTSSSKKDIEAKQGGRKKSKGAWSFGRDDLEAELARVGLRVKQGNEALHVELRQRVIAHMRANEEDFAPFVEDDESFPSYLARMKKDACWAGNLELVAASNLLSANIHVHQSGQPRWVVGSHTGDSVRTLHISYHDGQHYNSVRNADDLGVGLAPEPLVFKLAEGAGEATDEMVREGKEGMWGGEEEQRVCRGCGCYDRALVGKALGEAWGDVDAAIEKVIEYLSNQIADEGDQGVAVQAAGGGEAAQAAGGAACLEGGEDAEGADQRASPERPEEPIVTAVPARLEEAGPEGGEVQPRWPASAAPAGPEEETGASGAGEGPSGGRDPEETEALAGIAVEPQGLAAADSGTRPADDRGARPADASGGIASAPATAPDATSSHPASAPASPPPPVAPPRLRPVKTMKTVRLAVADKKPPNRNKPCPCGSGRKLKNCCEHTVVAPSKSKSRADAGGGSTAAAANLMATLHI